MSTALPGLNPASRLLTVWAQTASVSSARRAKSAGWMFSAIIGQCPWTAHGLEAMAAADDPRFSTAVRFLRHRSRTCSICHQRLTQITKLSAHGCATGASTTLAPSAAIRAVLKRAAESMAFVTLRPFRRSTCSTPATTPAGYSAARPWKPLALHRHRSRRRAAAHRRDGRAGPAVHPLASGSCAPPSAQPSCG
jgi:hypothetical protein